jgi:hypothetical protein
MPSAPWCSNLAAEEKWNCITMPPTRLPKSARLAPRPTAAEQILEYPAGSYVPQTTSTSYWPNEKVHKITRDTYDNNANFTGEFIQVFDESGKQISGHQLTHDPQTNFYHCADWNVSAQKYLTIDCPAGEESSGPPEAVKKFTQEEVTEQLAHARQAAQQPPKPGPAASPQPGGGTNVKEVGLILPARIRPGDRVSGSVVEGPATMKDYRESSLPGLRFRSRPPVPPLHYRAGRLRCLASRHSPRMVPSR